jgi:hypothetical protein
MIRQSDAFFHQRAGEISARGTIPLKIYVSMVDFRVIFWYSFVAGEKIFFPFREPGSPSISP